MRVPFENLVERVATARKVEPDITISELTNAINDWINELEPGVYEEVSIDRVLDAVSAQMMMSVQTYVN